LCLRYYLTTKYKEFLHKENYTIDRDLFESNIEDCALNSELFLSTHLKEKTIIFSNCQKFYQPGKAPFILIFNGFYPILSWVVSKNRLFTSESTFGSTERTFFITESPLDCKEHENGGFNPFYDPKWGENKGKKAENGIKLLPYGD